MALKKVCDACGSEITDQDSEPVEYRNVRLFLKADIHDRTEWKPADICRYCLHGASAEGDERTKIKAAPDKRMSLRYLAWRKGIRSPGPHAGFEFKDDAKKWIAEWEQGGSIEELE